MNIKQEPKAEEIKMSVEQETYTTSTNINNHVFNMDNLEKNGKVIQVAQINNDDNIHMNHSIIKQEEGEGRNDPITTYDHMDLSTMPTLDSTKINDHGDKHHAALSSYNNNDINVQDEEINVIESEDEIDIELVDNVYIPQLTPSNDNVNNTCMEISKKAIDMDNIHSHDYNCNNGNNKNNNNDLQQHISQDAVDNNDYNNYNDDISIHQSISQMTLNSNNDDIIIDTSPENTISKDDSDNNIITQLTNGRNGNNDQDQCDSISDKEMYQAALKDSECIKMDVELAKVSLDNDNKGIDDKNQMCDPMVVDVDKKENDIDPYFDGNESDVSSTCSYDIRVLKKIIRDDCIRCGRLLYPVPEQNYTRMKGTPEQYEELRQYARDHCWRCSRHFIIFELEWPLRRNKYFKLSVKNGIKK
ncbi:hypothetical protein BJ944DRAFT_260936 [Cunninghamella echinulata]|nr:hypothetical protein BJ944DRAFT_260936 [Cunninghamella echinulata]